MLGEKYRLKVGLSGIIEGSLPIGGLSSSASVIICFLSALCKVNGIHLEPMEMILTAKAAENQYVGVSCGKLDQSCEVLSKKNHLLYLDTKDDSYELIPTSEKMKPYKVAMEKLPERCAPSCKAQNLNCCTTRSSLKTAQRNVPKNPAQSKTTI